MDQEREARFPKCMRLQKRSEFLLVQRSGKKFHSRGFIGLAMQQSCERSRIGITTSKRLGNAVMRNRVRRLVREVFRRGLMTLPNGIDVVVIAKPRATSMTYGAIASDLGVLGRRITRHAEGQDQ